MSFFSTGGTLHLDARSYVTRRADQELLESLQRGEFCYILTARQMGKSSLMVRTATKLREETGAITALLDLSALGKNLTAEQWYAGILNSLGQLPVAGRPLDLEDELYDFYRDSDRLGLGPYQRWVRTLEMVLLPRCPGPVVLFVDEIDSVLSLPFSTDEFFAGIRECYNRRAENPLFARLTFCLAGVATPSDLIRDIHSTPFNIGRGIELHDFSEAEALPLAEGLVGLAGSRSNAEAIIRRVVYWSGGHPYLTQRLCLGLIELGQPRIAVPDVDTVCRDLFFTQKARERDDNLGFVRNRLLAGDADVTGLLELYNRALRRQKVRDTGGNPLASLLRLSGIVTRDVHGFLRPRNRIYEKVFDREWVRENLPNAELIRQKRAFQRGFLRASAVAGVIVAALGSMLALTLNALGQADHAAFIANMNLAGYAFQEGNIPRTLQILQEYEKRPAYRNRAEWRLLWNLCHDEILRLTDLPKKPEALYVSSDGKEMAIIGRDGSLARRHLPDGATLPCASSVSVPQVKHAAFSPDGKTVAVGTEEGEMLLCDVETGRALWTKKYHIPAFIWELAFSPDGKWVASADYYGSVHMIDALTGERRRILKAASASIMALDFSQDSRYLAAGDGSGTAHILNLTSGKVEKTLTGPTRQLRQVRFSPSGKQLLGIGDDKQIWLWDVEKQSGQPVLQKHQRGGQAVAFSPDGENFVTASYDQTAVVWDTQTVTPIQHIRGDGVPLWWTSYVGKREILTMTSRGTASLWTAHVAPQTLQDIIAIATTPDATQVLMATMPDAQLHLYDTLTGKEKATYPGGHTDENGKPYVALSVSYSSDGKIIATGGFDRTVRLWQMPECRLLYTLSQEDFPVGPKGGYHITISPDSSLLAAGTDLGYLQIWDLKTRNVLWKGNPFPDKSIEHLGFSRDAQTLLISLENEKALYQIDVRTGRESQPGIPLPDFATYFEYSPNYSLLSLCLKDGTVALYDLSQKRIIHRLFGHTNTVPQAVFSPDGQTLATGGIDGGIKLWDVRTGQETITLEALPNPIMELRFSSSGDALSVTDSHSHTRQYRLKPSLSYSTRKE